MTKCYPQVTLKVVFRSTNSIAKYFNNKDKVPRELLGGVIYKYECVCRSATYIGKCSRHLQTRIFEHLGRSPRTGNYLIKPLFSAIREHCENSDHRMERDNFSVLGSSTSDRDLIIMEALFHHHWKPNLGRSSYELLCF